MVFVFAVAGDHLRTHIPSVLDYFPELGGDLTKVVWAHAVNSRSLLENALANSTAMMLEADVVLGTVNGQNEIIPIMAHPPAQTSDLSLQMFLDTVQTSVHQMNAKKGVKLDFKSTDSFKMSLDIMDPLRDKIDFPFFLNADILAGPIESLIQPVDPEIFLSLSSIRFPECTLSIGWTTRYAPGLEGNYTADQLNSMKFVIENYKIVQPLTLCVRAGLAAQSDGIDNLVKLIDEYQQKNTTSVTVWMSTDSDPVDINKLRKLILTLEKNRVYLDVPNFIREQLDLADGPGPGTKET